MSAFSVMAALVSADRRYMEQEQAEEARLEALRPDRAKLCAYAKKLMAVAQPKVKTKEARKMLHGVWALSEQLCIPRRKKMSGGRTR